MTQQEYLKRFKQVCEYMAALTEKKNRNYAGNENAFKNFELISVITDGGLDIGTDEGILVRMTDKVQRIANLMCRPAAVGTESLEDSLIDLSVYSIIMYLWLTQDFEKLDFGIEEEVQNNVIELPPPTTLLQNLFSRLGKENK